MLTALVSLALAVSSPATLTITVWPNGPKAKSYTTTLTCEPTGGCAIARWNRVAFLFRESK